MDLCIHDCEMSGQLRASESFFSYFQVEIVGPIFLSFLKKKISQIFRCTGCPKKKDVSATIYVYYLFHFYRKLNQT